MFNLFYRNTRLLVLLICLILVAGLSSYYVLPRMEDPVVTGRNALVNTRFPGAGAARVEALVTEKLEDRLREIDEIKELRSVSRAGISTISVELRDEVVAADEVWSRLRDKINDTRSELPAGAMEPEFDEIDPKVYALIVALRWDQDDEPNYAILRRRAEELDDELRAIPGTEKVDLFGDPDEEIVVEIRAEKLAALGLSVEDVSRQLRASDAKVPAGAVRGRRGNLLLEVEGELDSLERIGRTPIRYESDGRFVLLGDIAVIDKGIAEPPRSLAVVGGRPAVALGAIVESNRRIDHWTGEARAVLGRFADELPRGVALETVFEQDRYVSTRLRGLLWNLLLGGMAVVAVMLVMMGWRSALVVGFALPMSALMVLSGLRFLGIPLHQMSVTGLIIALGLLIDNAVVIVAEVRDRLRKGVSPAEAVAQSVRHLAVPLFGSTLTTTLAFAPLALMPGPVGEFTGSIAVSVILAVFSSLLLAMTVIPAVTALVDRADTDLGGDSAGGAWYESGFSRPGMLRVYRATLDRIFRRPVWGIALAVVLPIAGFFQARKLPEQFFPPADRDQFHIELELPPQASLAHTLATVSEARRLILAHPQVEGVDWFLGRSAPSFYYNVIAKREDTANYAQALVQLKSAHGTRQLIHRLQDELDAAIPEARTLVRQLEQGPLFEAPVEVRIFGPDVRRLRELGEQVRQVLAELPDVIHTRADLGEALPKLTLRVDEEQARLAGLDHASIARQMDGMLEGAVGGSVLEATEELPVRVRLSGEDRSRLEHVASLDLVPNAATGDHGRRYLPLTALAQIDLVPEAAAIPRLDGRRMNEVLAFIPAGVLPSGVLDQFQRELAVSKFQLPPGYTLQFGGEAAKRDDAVGLLLSSAAVLVVLMVATLVLSFGSFRVAGLIGLVALLAVGLGLGSLWLFGYPFGFMAIIGTMGLVGVAINDAIVVVAALRADPKAREGDPTAVREVVIRSTRHVLATTLTTMAGFTPLVLAGGGFWPPLAVAIAGGVAGATLLALYFVPAAYILLTCRGRDPQRVAADGDGWWRTTRCHGFATPSRHESNQNSKDQRGLLPACCTPAADRHGAAGISPQSTPAPC